MKVIWTIFFIFVTIVILSSFLSFIHEALEPPMRVPAQGQVPTCEIVRPPVEPAEKESEIQKMRRELAVMLEGVGAVKPPINSRLPDTSYDVDNIIEKMEYGTIAFNSPTTINIDDTPWIQLILSLTETAEKLKASIRAVGERSAAAVKVCDRMEARLTGYMFQITAITPEVQAVSHHEPTEWRWEIHPKEEGEHKLHLTLSALFKVEDVQTQKTIRTFDKTIVVEVTGIQRIVMFGKKYWQWLWAVILVPVAGWVLKQRTKLFRKFNKP